MRTSVFTFFTFGSPEPPTRIFYASCSLSRTFTDESAFLSNTGNKSPPVAQVFRFPCALIALIRASGWVTRSHRR